MVIDDLNQALEFFPPEVLRLFQTCNCRINTARKPKGSMNANPLIQIKEAIWVFVVAFGVSWFGPSPSVHAVGPPPAGGYPDGQFSASETVTAGSTGSNIESPLATASWTGAVNTLWSNAGNWTAGGPPGATGNALFDASFTTSNQPHANGVTTGGIWMTSTVTKNVTISGPLLTIAGNVEIGRAHV